MDELPRRVILRRALQITAALAVAPRLIPRAVAAESCVDPASESLRSSLHYASTAPNPKQSCGACGFFTGDQSKPGCGNCQIMSGPVDQTGHCDSWSARSG
ncbi:MAG TPA: high-potential iron-sulfur protein [Steroidobacteraceae bacterium]|nr:high-potential iron-sulfur protein [Steroidobacteraceae bacterium]